MIDTSYMIKLTERLAFPAEATAYLAEADKLVKDCEGARLSMEEALWAFVEADYGFGGMELRHRRIGALAGISEYTAAMLFLLYSCKELEVQYAARKRPESLFLDTMADLRFKLMECKQVKGVWGTFVASWYPGFFCMNRFALGRFQYEKVSFRHDCYGVNGHFVKKGDVALNFHIPSSGVPLTKEVRYDSYRRARAFFFPDATGPVPIVCSSWLLFPGYESYIPDHLNLKAFRHDFTILSYDESENFSNAWRVFGADADKPVDKLPRDTSQRRLFADYCATGLPHGHGNGVFLFDGEKIIR